MQFSNEFIFSYPFGPTKPYRRPAVMLRFAFTKRSFPRAEIPNFSTYINQTTKTSKNILINNNLRLLLEDKMHWTIISKKIFTPSQTKACWKVSQEGLVEGARSMNIPAGENYICYTYLATHQSVTFIITLISNAFSRTAVFVEDSCCDTENWDPATSCVSLSNFAFLNGRKKTWWHWSKSNIIKRKWLTDRVVRQNTHRKMFQI